MPPTLAFTQLEYRVYRGPALALEGQAARAWLRRDTGEAAAEQVRVTLPPGEGSLSPVQLQAARVAGNLRTGEALASGGVTAERPGERVVTAAARYLPGDGLVHGEAPIEVRAPGLVLRGPGFTVDPRAGWLRVSGGARLELAPVAGQAGSP